MSKKKDFVENRPNIVEVTPENNSVIEELKKLGAGEVPSITELSDEALHMLIANLELNDSQGRTIVFQSEDEAVIYAAQLQRNIPQIRFCKIIPCYSILGGKFWVIEPMGTDLSQKMTPEELMSPSDLTFVNEVILMAIVESCKRERELMENK